RPSGHPQLRVSKTWASLLFFLRLLAAEIHQNENLSCERVIPIMEAMADKDWTDALLDRLAATRSRKESGAYQVTALSSRIALHIARHQAEVFGRFGLNRGEVGVLG